MTTPTVSYTDYIFLLDSHVIEADTIALVLTVYWSLKQNKCQTNSEENTNE